MQVFVRDNNVDQALKALKRKMQREGVFREMKLRKHYEKPSEKKVREKAEAIRRARKLARKKFSGRVCCRRRNLGWSGVPREERARRECLASDLDAMPVIKVLPGIRHTPAVDCAGSWRSR